MPGRETRRYSEAFKRQVVEELEGGRFASVQEAMRHHGIRGSSTLQRWVRQHGKDQLLGRVVRVERPDERDRMRELRRRVSELERALGQTQAERVIAETYLEVACERLGEEVEGFKKKCDGRRRGGLTGEASRG